MSRRRYDSMLPAAERSRLGAHYTPRELADELAQVALEPHLAPWGPALDWMPSEDVLRLRVVDLACGDGGLLAAAARRLTPILMRCARNDGRELSPSEARQLIERRCIIGNDVDANAVARARRLLPDAQLSVGDALFDFDVAAGGGPLVFIGNPPFLGGSKVSGALGRDYFQRLRAEYPTFRGHTDLCALFLLAAAGIVNRAGVDGTLSFITTKTISEGDTRRACLAVLLQPNETGVWTIWHAWRSRPWPGEANVSIAIVHLMHERMGRRVGFGPTIDETYRRFLGFVPDPERFRTLVDPQPIRTSSARIAVQLDGATVGFSEAG